MSTEAETPNSPRVWIAAICAIGFMVSLAVGIVTLAGGVLAIGVWKGGIDNRVAAVESASKEQISALAAATDKQVQAVTTGCKEMVAAVDKSTSTRLETIEHDRSERIQEATRWRAEQGAITTKLETVITQQQKQIDLLTTEQNARRHP